MKLRNSLLALLVAGCGSTSQTAMRMAENAGHLRIDTPSGPDHDYRVFMTNSVAPDWTGNNPADRLRMATAYLAAQCMQSRLVRETPIQTGTYLTGRKATTWVMEIACDR